MATGRQETKKVMVFVAAGGGFLDRTITDADDKTAVPIFLNDRIPALALFDFLCERDRRAAVALTTAGRPRPPAPQWPLLKLRSRGAFVFLADFCVGPEQRCWPQ